ncbi:hypothetical protein CN918_29470 [Priestia megaterium]|nr:hypothetical protein CN918_29470 [Priestia megaterium]
MPQTTTTYELGSFDVLEKGDLKGYTNEFIHFKFTNSETGKPDETAHEFLYRYEDEANGPNNKLVSIDYGYLVPGIDELWEGIEEELKKKTLEKLN